MKESTLKMKVHNICKNTGRPTVWVLYKYTPKSELLQRHAAEVGRFNKLL